MSAKYMFRWLLLITISFPNQCLSQSEYKSTEWINSFLERHPNFNKINITIDGECQTEKSFISRKKYKEHYGTIYKDSFCNAYASSGKFEVGVRIDSFPNSYFFKEIQLADSAQVNVDLPYKKLKQDFDLTTLLLDQDLKNDTLKWVQVSQDHWFSNVDTLKIYSKEDELNIEWTSIQMGYNSNSRKLTKKLSPDQIDLLKAMEARSNTPRDKSLTAKYRAKYRDRYSYHIISYRNVGKVYREQNWEANQWRSIRALILAEEGALPVKDED